jgi:hypothetical protein
VPPTLRAAADSVKNPSKLGRNPRFSLAIKSTVRRPVESDHDNRRTSEHDNRWFVVGATGGVNGRVAA